MDNAFKTLIIVQSGGLMLDTFYNEMTLVNCNIGRLY